jgi:hypothetical protein
VTTQAGGDIGSRHDATESAISSDDERTRRLRPREVIQESIGGVTLLDHQILKSGGGDVGDNRGCPLRSSDALCVIERNKTHDLAIDHHRIPRMRASDKMIEHETLDAYIAGNEIDLTGCHITDAEAV